MSDPKSRNDSVETKKDEINETARFLNLGIPVKLSFGDFTVEELDVITLGQLASGGLDLLVTLKAQEEANENPEEASKGGHSDFSVIQKVIIDPQGKKLIGKLFASYCGQEDTKPFEKLKIKDFNILWKAIKSVTDFDEIRELFFNLGLQAFLPMIPTSTENTETTAQDSVSLNT